jgi:hypothetical protein
MIASIDFSTPTGNFLDVFDLLTGAAYYGD